MFTNLTHHAGLTQAQHRALPGLSNTDLSALADQLLGRPRHAGSPAALAFGSHFHTATLEPHLFTPTNPHDPADEQARARAAALARRIRRQRYPRHVLYRGQAEQSYTATHDATGLTVKVRPDLLIDSPAGLRRTLVDFKTTSCRDLPQFLATVEQYGYDRQQALYADVLQAHRALLIAVQKNPPKNQEPAVWVVELTAEQLANGRRKYARLLRAHAEQATASQRPVPLLPTSPAPARLLAAA
ncbi:hypothetical protein HHL22_11980 [Hymenobacter sp. RP-2-7]|uniref:Putative exodeoxyribonuclease 8 PDDEXK-like domain-containing protein n=1 Tax=Hymenobacter polaris TaxID=2682546 RepID=A0A7Y0FMZ2_9BACT|nr:PD-(D/E)XK nuclease-like domain-containing protein [Hymenobacter polaris]NML65925.1 hypothetical protein [Hymenobacter polaris]